MCATQFHRVPWLVSVGCLALLATCTGCPRGKSTAVLAGRWQLQPANPGNLGDLELTFDVNGHLALISYPVAGFSAETSSFDSNAGINGDQVNIDASFGSSTFSFGGTLTADLNSIVGTTSLTIAVPGATATIATGDATLVRIH